MIARREVSLRTLPQSDLHVKSLLRLNTGEKGVEEERTRGEDDRAWLGDVGGCDWPRKPGAEKVGPTVC